MSKESIRQRTVTCLMSFGEKETKQCEKVGLKKSLMII